MTDKKTILLVLLLFFILTGCVRSPVSDFQVVRLIDHLSKDNITVSPLAGISEDDEEFLKIYPPRSFPLQDLGSGDNPYGIKRKLKQGEEEINALFAPPKSQYSYALNLKEDSVLEFGIGIVRKRGIADSDESISPAKRGCTFLISLEINGRKKTVFHKYLPFPSGKLPFVFSMHSLDIPYSKKNVLLSLHTEGNEQNYSYWFNPVLYRKGKNRRNVILVSVDTLRADHLGCYGYKRDTSPHLDSFCSDSAVFLNTYTSSPWTLPSHVSLLTSLHGIHHQVYFEDEKMDPSLLTLADMLRQNHFFCSAITGGGFASSAYGLSKGFDSYKQATAGIYQSHSAEWTFTAVSQWLDRNKDKNFFLFIHTYQPHNPYSCPSPYGTMFLEDGARWQKIDLLRHVKGKKGIFKPLPEDERRNIIDLYDGEIRYTDEMLIKPLMQRLKELELYDQTMIIFTSDHGEEFFEHKGWEHGHSLYDELLKVPLIIKFPDSKYAGKKIESIVALVDILPTVLDEMDMDPPETDMDGTSLIPILKGRDTKDRTFYADKGDNVLKSRIPQKISTNIEKNKLILNKKFTLEDLSFFRFPPPAMLPVELYDLVQDPGETRDISEEKAKIVSQLIRLIEEKSSKAKKKDTSKAEIDEDIKEQLRALGYLQ
jgi:arylsulfatase A-like enzyme